MSILEWRLDQHGRVRDEAELLGNRHADITGNQGNQRRNCRANLQKQRSDDRPRHQHCAGVNRHEKPDAVPYGHDMEAEKERKYVGQKMGAAADSFDDHSHHRDNKPSDNKDSFLDVSEHLERRTRHIECKVGMT